MALNLLENDVWVTDPQIHESFNSTIIVQDEGTPNNQEDPDILICGRCKIQFSSFKLFVEHKDKECLQNNVMILNQPSLSIVEPLLIFNPGKALEKVLTLTIDKAICEEIVEPSDVALSGVEDTHVATVVNLENESIVSVNKSIETKQRKRRIRGSLSKVLVCSYCDRVFSKHFDLIQHERIHTGEKPYQCSICGRAFSQKSNVRKHVETHKVYPDGKHTLILKETDSLFLKSVTYNCQYCSSSFDKYYDYKKHLTTHSELKVFKCLQKGCFQTFQEMEEFLNHSYAHKETEFTCHMCFRVFPNLTDLGRHQQEHNRSAKQNLKRTLMCKICRAIFKSEESLRKHEATDNHNHICPKCNVVFKCERYLRRHLQIHCTMYSFFCNICLKTFRSKSNLNRHNLIHTTNKPYICGHCGRSYATKYILKRHILVLHLNIKYECSLKQLGCNKTFARKDKLYAHEVTHGNCKTCRTRKRLCENCLKKINLNQTEHPFKCNNCSQDFDNLNQLSKHSCLEVDRNFIDTTIPSKSELDDISNIEILVMRY